MLFRSSLTAPPLSIYRLPIYNHIQIKILYEVITHWKITESRAYKKLKSGLTSYKVTGAQFRKKNEHQQNVNRRPLRSKPYLSLSQIICFKKILTKKKIFFERVRLWIAGK